MTPAILLPAKCNQSLLFDFIFWLPSVYVNRALCSIPVVSAAVAYRAHSMSGSWPNCVKVGVRVRETDSLHLVMLKEVKSARSTIKILASVCIC